MHLDLHADWMVIMALTHSATDGGVRAPAPEPLWRQVLGLRLRSLRVLQGQTLAETAARAGISPQYLSEIERGLKDASSEMVAAIVGALNTSLVELTFHVADDLRRHQLLEVSRSAGQTRTPLRSSDEMLTDVAEMLGVHLAGVHETSAPTAVRLVSSPQPTCRLPAHGTVILAA